jgi:hypothetical protein
LFLSRQLSPLHVHKLCMCVHTFLHWAFLWGFFFCRRHRYLGWEFAISDQDVFLGLGGPKHFIITEQLIYFLAQG